MNQNYSGLCINNTPLTGCLFDRAIPSLSSNCATANCSDPILCMLYSHEDATLGSARVDDKKVMRQKCHKMGCIFGNIEKYRKVIRTFFNHFHA